MSEETVTVRLLLADGGTFHYEDVELPAEALARHDRLVDVLREDFEVLRGLHVNLDRLCTARVVTE